MRKALIFVLAGMMLAAVATGAFAAHSGVATGEGKNNPCDEPPPDGDGRRPRDDRPGHHRSRPDESQGQSHFCPGPVDPTADLADQTPPEADPLFIGADDNGGQGLRVGVAIGDEGEENSVGRVGVAVSEEGGLQVYGEDYTEGDVVANAVEDVDRVTGCVLIPPDPEEDQDCAVESDDDTALITLHP